MPAKPLNTLAGVFTKQGKGIWASMVAGVEHNLAHFSTMAERDFGKAMSTVGRHFMAGAGRGAMIGAAGGAALAGVDQLQSGSFSMGGIAGGAFRGAIAGGLIGGSMSVARRGITIPAARPAPPAAGPTGRAGRIAEMRAAAARAETAGFNAGHRGVSPNIARNTMGGRNVRGDGRMSVPALPASIAAPGQSGFNAVSSLPMVHPTANTSRFQQAATAEMRRQRLLTSRARMGNMHRPPLVG